jgi:condensin complex subunit 2
LCIFSLEYKTLVKEYDLLTIKKFDLEFAIDPLFKKTIAEFDESGGAQSLLLNQLSVNANGKIIFDASDAKLDNNRMATETIEKDNVPKIYNPEILLGIFIFLIIEV